MQETRFHLWVRKIPWSRKWQPTLVFLHGKSHGCRRLMGCSPWGQKRVRHDWVTEHTLTPLPPHMHSLLLYQYLPPEWCICYNWWTYIDTSLSLRGLTLGVVHCMSLDKCAADPAQCEFEVCGSTYVQIFFSNGNYAAAAKLLQSCPALCHPLDYSPPASSVHGILQARILEGVTISSSRNKYYNATQYMVGWIRGWKSRYREPALSYVPINPHVVQGSAVQWHVSTVISYSVFSLP